MKNNLKSIFHKTFTYFEHYIVLLLENGMKGEKEVLWKNISWSLSIIYLHEKLYCLSYVLQTL